MSVEIRSYIPSDFEVVAKIHEASGFDYKMPNLNSSLFLVTKVLTVDGVVRAALGARIEVELYLWLDKGAWAEPEEKWLAVKALDKETMESLHLLGVDCAVLFLPPGMERFGRRLEADFGFSKNRDGWYAYTKPTGEKR